MTLDDLTVNFSHLKQEDILSDWEWLIGREKLPILITAFGEAFIQDIHSGSVHFLNVAEATITHVAKSSDDLKAKLSDKEFVSEFLAVQAVSDLRQMGNSLSYGQVYSFKKPPILGGKIAPDNIEATDIEVHFSILGQLHSQVKKLPYGTKIGNVEVKLNNKPWWKLWR